MLKNKNKNNLDMTCFLCPECPRPGSDGKCCFQESGKMYFVCLFYKGKESITTKKKKVRSGSFMSSCQQEGQHTENLEKITQTDFSLWSTRQKISYTELMWKSLTMQQYLFTLIWAPIALLIQKTNGGSVAIFVWLIVLFCFQMCTCFLPLFFFFSDVKKQVYNRVLILLKSKGISINTFQ